jgi:hypothetical protein
MAYQVSLEMMQSLKDRIRVLEEKVQEMENLLRIFKKVTHDAKE